jgi:diguanylate cyclase (GGDEF)-like protein
MILVMETVDVGDVLGSLYEAMPDGVILYDRDGHAVAANAAARRLVDFGPDRPPGGHYRKQIRVGDRALLDAAVVVALEGGCQRFESSLVQRDGCAIRVEYEVFAATSRGAACGFFLQLRDAIALREAGERIRQLYLVAAARGHTSAVQIDRTIALGLRLFGFDFGYVARFDGDEISIENAVGTLGELQAGQRYPADRSMTKHVRGARELLEISDLDAEPWRDDPGRAQAPWKSYVAIQLRAGGRIYGALAFARRTLGPSLDGRDRDLLDLMALFVASALERAQHEERIEHLAFSDALTDLPNRLLFDDRIRHTIATSRRYARGFALMFLDIDNFKNVNDTYGHAVGDDVLRAVARRLSKLLRDSDTLARLGGDEFVILQPVIDRPLEAESLARKLVESMRRPVVVEGIEHRVHVSIGIALFPQDGASARELTEASDRALYAAKRAGRDRWLFSADATS